MLRSPADINLLPDFTLDEDDDDDDDDDEEDDEIERIVTADADTPGICWATACLKASWALESLLNLAAEQF